MDFITYPLLLNADTMPHGAFVKLILLHLDVIGITDPVFMYSKNTAKPPNETLMSATDEDEENKVEDGFLHLIYTNEEEGVPIPAKKAAARHKSPCRFKRRKKIGMIQLSIPIGLLDSWNHDQYRRTDHLDVV
ncbi:uncharacterized protein LOC125468066 [Pyrus x bretschneideri]|uniref:uncharacterized protein LOC125468066 n=1 Tax=Pyrus x bretschneideri TaxID=225117 RepID=UPI00202F01F6|nr:uncharacterized protein LOC125468066 [Pyrus x bretschneideri]